MLGIPRSDAVLVLRIGDKVLLGERTDVRTMLMHLSGLFERATKELLRLLDEEYLPQPPEIMKVDVIMPYLLHCRPNGRRQAAAGLIRALFQHVPDAPLTCLNCEKRKGVCRCTVSGFERGNEWVYRGGGSADLAGRWGLTRSDLAEVNPVAFEILSPNVSHTLYILLEVLKMCEVQDQ